MVADVNDKGEVTVEGEHVGRLEGFRFHSGSVGDLGRGEDALVRRRAFRRLRRNSISVRTGSTTPPIPRSTLPIRAG